MVRGIKAQGANEFRRLWFIVGLKMEPAGIGWGGIGAGAVGGCGDGNGAYMDECGDGDGAYMEGHA